MNALYARKKVTVQMQNVSTPASVLDSSSQGEFLQRKADMANGSMQREERPNNTGMPDNLKAGIESLSGFSMDDVRVHYNSSKPATVQALAYTQGTDIHVAPGQEKCLPHEAWHVAQQMAGRVSPTTNINGMPVNDNAALEHEADVMGEKAVQCKIKTASVKKNVPFGKNVQRLKYEGKKKEIVDVFCANWDGIYAEILAKKRCPEKEVQISEIEPISVFLTEGRTTSFSVREKTVWINKKDVNGNQNQLFQKCLHELGHFVDYDEKRSDYYADDYHRKLQNQKANGQNEVYSSPYIASIGREFYADMFAFAARMQKERPKNDNDLNAMIKSIDFSERPQEWVEVQYYKGYPPAKYEKKLIFEYGKKLIQEKSEFEYVKCFDENFNNILKIITDDIQTHQSEVSKGMVLIHLLNWYNGKIDANTLQGAIDFYRFTEADVTDKFQMYWDTWVWENVR